MQRRCRARYRSRIVAGDDAGSVSPFCASPVYSRIFSQRHIYIYLRVRVPAVESRIIPSPIASRLQRPRRLVGPCAFTCIQGAPLVVIKLSRMTDLPGFRDGDLCTISAGVRMYIAALREAHRAASSRRDANALARRVRSLEKFDRTRIDVCVRARARQVAITRAEIQRVTPNVMHMLSRMSRHVCIKRSKARFFLLCSG